MILLPESIYSHHDKIDGRDICFNIWDSLCPQVRKIFVCFLYVCVQLTGLMLDPGAFERHQGWSKTPVLQS